MTVPAIRIREANGRPLNPRGELVLYWMTAFRRTRFNFALQHAIDRAVALELPLLVLEPLRVGYRWASDRHHRFVIEGMVEHAAELGRSNAGYLPYLEPAPGAGRGLLEALAEHAALVVGDDAPLFFLPRMVAAAAHKLSCKLELVDSNGILPLRASEQVFSTAHAFRRFLQQALPLHLSELPKPAPLSRSRLRPPWEIPPSIAQRWPAAALETPIEALLSALPIDHTVAAATFQGGTRAAEARLDGFIEPRLTEYDQLRNEPERDGSSGLSPYLHFGQLAAHQVLSRVLAAERWSPDRLASTHNGSREGWWGLSKPAEAFLDQLITWRELGFNSSAMRDDAAEFTSLPGWAQATLHLHRSDPRPQLYGLAQLEAGVTHDPLWNAAQHQLTREGRMHNYLRMLWGKKILEWSPSPELALEWMLELNDKYAVDGRDPNSLSGIFWCLGRYDRPWGPERPIFGLIRYMSSENTARKFRVRDFIARYEGAFTTPITTQDAPVRPTGSGRTSPARPSGKTRPVRPSRR